MIRFAISTRHVSSFPTSSFYHSGDVQMILRVGYVLKRAAQEFLLKTDSFDLLLDLLISPVPTHAGRVSLAKNHLSPEKA